MFRRCLRSVAAHPWRVLIVMVLLGTAGVVGGRHLYAWYHFRAGRSALEQYHTEKSRQHLGRCLGVWSSSSQTHLLARRAARRAGDVAAAEEHLRACQRLRRGADDETALEWALLSASTCQLEEVEKFLVEQSRASPAHAPLILEALTQGYLRVYRILDALHCVGLWLQLDPDNVRALTLRGDIHWQIQVPLKAVADYRTVVERDPEQDEVRWRAACWTPGRSPRPSSTWSTPAVPGRTTPRFWCAWPGATTYSATGPRRATCWRSC